MSQTTAATALAARQAAVDRLSQEHFDVVVVGGGITGAGAALDAASRGLRVALVERDDIAVGTSSRSGKLIHGGLRYLEYLGVGLVREALAERHRLLRLAPHLVRLERFLFPVYGSPLALPYYGAGLTLYDLLGAARDGGRTHLLSGRAARALAPALHAERLRGGLLYHDAVEDDARYTLAVVRSARSLGAVVVTRCAAVELLETGGRIAGIRVRDELGGAELDVRAEAVVDATGHWAAGGSGPFAGIGAGVVPSRGVHLVVPRERIPGRAGLTIRVPGRVVFLIPWRRHWLIGTTDEPYDGSPDRPAATEHEVAYLLEHLNRVLDVGLRADELTATFAGIRPLAPDPGTSSTVRASREHRVLVPRGGLVSVRGGKFTTYRLMGRDAIDAAGAHRGDWPPSRTVDLALHGSLPVAMLGEVAESLAERHALDPELARGLVRRHGSDTEAVAALGAELDLLRPLAPEHDYLEVEVLWGVREELALSLDDLLARRMHLSFEARDHGAGVAARVAELMAPELGWETGRVAPEVEAYAASSAREYGVPGATRTPAAPPGGEAQPVAKRAPASRTPS